MKTSATGKTLKAIGFLLAYPQGYIREAAPEINALLQRESWLSECVRVDIKGFMDYLGQEDLLDIQEAYVELFDRTPSLSLHLFEHVHGDSRDRGQAMVELDGLYREIGLENASEHTPDYLPLFLEYLSLLPVEQARANLDGALDVIAVIGERLKKRGSRYAVLFDALQEASSRKPDEKKLQSALAAHAGDMMSQAEMDAAWEDQFALGEPSQAADGGGCPKVQDILARMNAPLDETDNKNGARS
ncbi:MAG: nitrate reductase molybdenum cofactor assembly chaperone [Micavibrio aeruginosavorus]|uniref:Nitrate reductase molybdenum cofactor assembly chaperone n=1 Tax=Micavibrio aeruginosavorus TaxID=349221 RepID=A0A7T5UHH3_9BACT|nr:MAG: nitrate reductase molybdenum cofactor assembly chaperone [Micavibrio aeruginosavorus]